MLVTSICFLKRKQCTEKVSIMEVRIQCSFAILIYREKSFIENKFYKIEMSQFFINRQSDETMKVINRKGLLHFEKLENYYIFD